MTTIPPLIDLLFYGLVMVQLTALLFLGLAMLLRRLTREPVERIRITVTAFCAIPLVLVAAVTPFVPKWSIALWQERPTVSQEPSPAETFYPVPPAITHDLAMMPAAHVTGENATNPNRDGDGAIVPLRPLGDARSFESSAYCVHGSDSGVTVLPLLFPLGKGCIVIGFIAVTLGMIAFYLVARVRLRRITRTTVAAPQWLERLFRNLTADCRNNVTLRVSPRIDSPMLCGLLRPMILLPMSMTLESNAATLRCALAHEWAHHRRSDLWTWCVVRACRWLFWPQPFYWHLAGELRVDQDYLADDTASRSNANSDTEAEQYASVLLHLAKRRVANAALDPWIGQTPVLGFADTTPLLTRRIEMLLKDKNRFRGTSRRLWLLTMCSLFFGLAAVFGSVRFTTVAATTLPVKNETAAIVDVQPDDDIIVEVRLLVVDDEQKPVSGAKVELRYSDWSHPIEQYWETDADGMVVTQIPQLVIDHQNRFQVYHRERGLIGSADFPTDKPGIVDPMEVTCKLIKARRITGQVLDQDGSPVEGAYVGGTWSYRIGCNLSDDQGHFFIDVSPVQPLESIFAFKPGVGYDSLRPDLKPTDSDYYTRLYDQEAWLKDENIDNGPFTFKLSRQEPITVKVVDKEGNPIEGILVYPNGAGFSMDHIFETNCYEGLMGQKTNKDGLVMFDWLPAWQRHCYFTASGSNPRFDKTGNARLYGQTGKNSVEQEGDESFVVISLPKRVEIQGSVRYEDVSPATRLQLQIIGKNFATLGEYTDHAGHFSYDVNEGEPITVHPITNPKQPLTAPAIYLDSVGDGTTPVPRFDFVLKKGTKLFGRVLSPETGEAVPNAYIRIYEMRSPDDTMENRMTNERYARADNDGNYNVQLPPGWAHFRKTKSAIKMHTKINLRGKIPARNGVAKNNTDPYFHGENARCQRDGSY